jgi:hypothetical protein
MSSRALLTLSLYIYLASRRNPVTKFFLASGRLIDEWSSFAILESDFGRDRSRFKSTGIMFEVVFEERFAAGRWATSGGVIVAER